MKDKSADERFELGLKIQNIENKQDEFSQLKKNFEHSLDRFRSKFQRIANKNEALLYESQQSGNQGINREIERNGDLNQLMNRYVGAYLEELKNSSRQIRLSLDDEREGLIKERNSLPWE